MSHPTLKAGTAAVAAEVRALAARHQVRYTDLAAACGLSLQAFSRRATGDVPFNVGEVLVIAPLLSVSPSELLDDLVEAAPTTTPAAVSAVG
ncbi:MAG: helix-turn-helix domain-containing protein [Baekduiaceae bacterium]